MNHFVGFWQPKYFSTYSSRLCLGETSVYLCFHSNEGCCNMLQRDHFPPISWNWPGHSTMLCRFTLRGRLTGKAEHGHNDGFEGFLGTSLAARLNISEINGRRKTVGPIKLARMVICNIPTYWNLFSPCKHCQLSLVKVNLCNLLWARAPKAKTSSIHFWICLDLEADPSQTDVYHGNPRQSRNS